METIQTPTSTGIIYASFLRRFAALVIDRIIIKMVCSFLLFPMFLLMGLGIFDTEFRTENFADSGLNEYHLKWMSFIGISGLASLLTFICVSWLYFSLMESSSRQASFGKIAMGLKVTKVSGEKISFSRASIRYVGKIISGATMLFGYIMAAFTPKKQALHDIIAETVVVKI